MARAPVTIDSRPPAETTGAGPLGAWSALFPFLSFEVIVAEARLEGDRVHVRGARRRYHDGTLTEERFQGEADAEALAQGVAELQQQMMAAAEAFQRGMLGVMFPWLPWSR